MRTLARASTVAATGPAGITGVAADEAIKAATQIMRPTKRARPQMVKTILTVVPKGDDLEGRGAPLRPFGGFARGRALPVPAALAAVIS